MRPTLILGGTTEASRLAAAMSEAGLPAVLSYAGRTENPRAQPVPVRVGGFGGAEGLARYLASEGIGRVIDATHPFAAQMSRNAVAACAAAQVPLAAFERPAWAPEAGDRWTIVADIPAAARALAGPPERVFLAIGRQHLAEFGALPHWFLLRLVDAPDALPLPRAEAVIARGPFDAAGDRALMERYGITRLVAKNAGGAGAQAKIAAARALGLPVVMIARPVLPARTVLGSVAAVLGWLHADLGV